MVWNDSGCRIELQSNGDDGNVKFPCYQICDHPIKLSAPSQGVSLASDHYLSEPKQDLNLMTDCVVEHVFQLEQIQTQH